MSLKNAILVPAFLTACAASLAIPVCAQQSTPPPANTAPAEDIPDAPMATAAAMTVPNGPMVVFDTSMGRITCQFYRKEAPKAVANFIELAEGTRDWTDPTTNKVQHRKPLFDGTTFHRVIPGFMIQGGDPAGTGMGGPGYSFEDEVNPDLTFDRPGRLAMANSGPNTNGSQFFITEQPYPSLDMHYSLFGQCDDAGVEVVKSITAVPRDSDDKPLSPVLLKKVTIVAEGQPMPPLPAASQPAPQPAPAATHRP